MYTPKFLLLIFNLILIIVSGIYVGYGLLDTTSSKLKPLESATDMSYFKHVWIYGGALLFAIACLGFWGADAESRIGLITFKFLLFIFIGIQGVVICYFLLNSNSVTEQIHNQLKIWTEEYGTDDNATEKLDHIQSYLHCCEITPKTHKSIDNYPTSCCLFERRISEECNEESAFTETCTKTASDYFRPKSTINVFFVLRTIVPETASLLFANMVIKKIVLLENLMQGKLT